MKKFVYLIASLTLIGCGVQNNVSFTTSQGSCADGTNNAPYCMSLTIQNNAGGQNYITSTNFPIKNLTLSTTGNVSNLIIPTQGSKYDPNNCLGSSISPGGTCTFYVQLAGESVPVESGGQPITITANYNIDNTLFGGSSTTASASTTIYQTPNLIVSNNSGIASNYANSIWSGVYATESGNQPVIASTNDNYYGFLYLVSNNAISLSGNQTYSSNMIESLTGVSNILMSGTTGYTTSSGGISTSKIQPLSSLYWNTYSYTNTGLVQNVITTSGGRVFVAYANGTVVNCQVSSSGGCTQEGVTAPANVTALAYSVLGTSGSVNLTGLVLGTVSGLYVESGIGPSPTNGWVPVVTGGTNPITTSIKTIVTDIKQNVYIADNNTPNSNIYLLPVNGGNSATAFAPSIGQIIAMVYDSAGNKLYVANNIGNVYACTISGVINCNPINNGLFQGNIFGLNIITSLTSS